jgi:hypothetical protein
VRARPATPAMDSAEVLVELALNAAAIVYEDGNERERAAVAYVVGSILHAETTPAHQAILARMRNPGARVDNGAATE